MGKAFVYYATHAPQATFKQLMHDLLQRVFHGDPVSLVASLFETQPPSTREVEQLKRMLDELRTRKGKKS